MKAGGNKNNSIKRIFGVSLVLGLFCVLAIPLLQFTIGQYYYQKARDFSFNNQYDQALQQLEKASSWQPNDAAIQYELGLTQLKKALDMNPMFQRIIAAKAVEYFQLSQELNSLEPETAYGLARASELLGDTSREQTLAAYNRAVELWPNNSLYRKAFARELFRQGLEQELLATVQTLGAIDPASYGQLKHEPYWSAETEQVFAKGVEQAVLKNIDLRNAHMTLAAILEEQGKWDEATAEYQKGMGFEQHRNTQHNFYRLGTLLLHTDTDAAATVFLQGLAQSDTREKDLEGLYNTFKKAAEPGFQLAFYEKVKNRFRVSWRLDILMARTLIDAEQYEEAKEALEEVVLQEQVPEPWYWMARIGELTRDWDGMELAIQRACVLDPDNSEYRMKFSQALARQEKLAQAEEQATRAITAGDKPNPWYYNHRAWLRWNQKNYEDALQDWQEANRLAPDNAAFYGQIGLAYKKLGLYDLAMVAYSEALERDPDNEKYKKELGR